MFPGSRQPKIIKSFIQQVQTIKRIDGMKKHDFNITESEFVRYFANEHILGTIQILIKKMLYKQVTVDFQYLPGDHLFCIMEKQFKDAFAAHRAAMKHQKKALEHPEVWQKQLMEHIQQMTKGMTLAYKNDARNTILEVSLDKDRSFIVLNSN